MKSLFVLGAAALAGCGADVDEPWKLDHDRIVAVRAEPPRIAAGEQSKLDMLVGFADAPAMERAPDLARVVQPMSMADTLRVENGQWIVTAPSDDVLAAVRSELGMMPGEPVPLIVGVAAQWPNPVMSPDPAGFGATKTIWLGESVANPMLAGLTINGVDPGTGDLVVAKDTEIPLYVEADDNTSIVNWLTSCGEMHDFDLHNAYLTVGPTDPQDGQLAVVLRDPTGGVAWRVWSIRAD